MSAPLKIWLLRDCEPLPLKESTRLMRMGRLARTLATRGHEVTWWASTFDHFQKKKLFAGDHTLTPSPGLTLRLLDAGNYTRNVSWNRIRHHARLGKMFREKAATLSPPDVIVASFPTIALAYEGALYARAHGIPFIVDVRDLWPDSFCDFVPGWAQPLVTLATSGLQRKTRVCFQEDDSLLAMSEHVRAWAFAKRGALPPPKGGVFYLGSEPPRLPSESALASLKALIKARVVFTYLGSFGKAHDFEALLDVITDSATTLPQAFFFIAGAGEFELLIKKHTEGLSNVHLLGWQDHEAAARLLAVSDVMLIPCRFDAVPNKFCEALAWGKPVIPSGPDIAEMKEICERYGIGLFYPNADRATLYAHVKTLTLDESLRKEMGERALALYRDAFQADGVDGRYAAHVEEMARMNTQKE